jgi:hypothetical protein
LQDEIAEKSLIPGPSLKMTRVAATETASPDLGIGFHRRLEVLSLKRADRSPGLVAFTP